MTELHRRRRHVLAALASIVPAVAIVITYAVWRGGLGSDVAFHWNAAGRVDGVIPTLAAYWCALIVAIASGIAGAAISLVAGMGAQTKRDYLTWTGFCGGLALALWLVPAGLTHAAGSAQDARLSGWLALLATFLLYGVVVRAFVPRGAGVRGDGAGRPRG